MAEHEFLVSREAIDDFARRLSDWAHTLDERHEAMLVDLLAKAGGDVFGQPLSDTISDGDRGVTSSELSPLELRDFARAVTGIFNADQSVTA
jgi:hypothetical protein